MRNSQCIFLTVKGLLPKNKYMKKHFIKIILPPFNFTNSSVAVGNRHEIPCNVLSNLMALSPQKHYVLIFSNEHYWRGRKKFRLIFNDGRINYPCNLLLTLKALISWRENVTLPQSVHINIIKPQTFEKTLKVLRASLLYNKATLLDASSKSDFIRLN